MLSKKSEIYCLFLILLCANSLFYCSEIREDGEESTTSNIAQKHSISPPTIDNNFSEDSKSSTTLTKQTQTTGNYKLAGFFIQDNLIDISEDGEVFEWEPYEDVKGNEWDCITAYFRQESSNPSTWPPEDTYATLPSYYLINGKHIDSTIFSPVFNYETKIQGKIFFLVFERDRRGESSVLYTLRITMELFNPANQEATEILSVEHFPMDDHQHTFSATLENTVTIPAGYRLRVKYEAKRDRNSYDYTMCEIRSGYYDVYESVYWEINDLNNTYDNTYTFDEIENILGVQLYMYQEHYPTIDVYGISNNTVYYEPTNATVSVSESVLNRYKWDSDSFTEFNSPFITSIPETIGWHTLTIEARDFYDNIITEEYQVGYDTTPNRVVLHNPTNNSLVTDGEPLDFSLYDVTSSSYEWDLDGNQIAFSAPYDIYPNRGFTGVHRLTIHITSIFGSEDKTYFFEFDNSAPIITLDDPQNNTYQPPSKNIYVEIGDRWEALNVSYKWDGDSFTSWDPYSGDIYRTKLPTTEEWHTLTVTAEDGFGLSDTKVYRFYTDVQALLVDLETMINGSYYLGGNTVEVLIVNHNGTVKYFWGNDSPKDGTVIDDILTLSGAEGLSQIPGTCKLTIIAGDELNVQHEYLFEFTVDQEKPVIEQTIPAPNYNNSRFLQSKVFSFSIHDNWTSTQDLVVLISVDGGTNQAFSAPYNYYLDSLDEGVHDLTIFAQDTAGNEFSYFITFTIDISAPEITTIIDGLAELPSGSKYIPANAEITCTIFDDDPVIESFYAWNGSSDIPFIGSFTLPATEGLAALLITVHDSLGNTAFDSYQLTVDNSHPTVSLNFIENNSKINEITVLRFKVQDLSEDTIDLISTQWDIEDNPVIRAPTFTADLLIQYATYQQAKLTIYAQDIVGNDYTCTYRFYLDFEPPSYYLQGAANNTYVKGGTVLDFEVTSDDIEVFYYRWDLEDDYQEVNEPWNITVPTSDGIKTLYIRLEDDTGGGLYPNFVEVLYIFVVDDIDFTILAPEDMSEDYYYTMNYGESFTFSIDIRTKDTGVPLTGLNITTVHEDETLALGISILQINETSYEFTILATNITNGDFTNIEFKFWQLDIHKQSIFTNLRILRQEGNVLIMEYSNTVTYEENITISFQMTDDSNVTALEVLYLRINDYDQGFVLTTIDVANLIYQVTFDTELFVNGKGNYSFELYVESNFYYGVKNDTVAISINIQAIPITLAMEVSDNEIVYGNVLAITATLLRENITAIQFENLTFSFGIIYKNHKASSRVAILSLDPSDYDEIINITTSTNVNGIATMTFEVTEEMEHLSIQVAYKGNERYDPVDSVYGEAIQVIPPEGLPMKIIIIIIAASVLFAIIVAFVVYRLVRSRPFEELMEKITEEEIYANMEQVSPGVVLSIFDQKRGPIPLVSNHSFETGRYKPRMQIGVENFLLKISDQAYSTLGFEELDEKRRIGSINLPSEEMVGFIHGIQLENKVARGGFENLSLIVLADAEYGGLLLANQEFLFAEIDDLIAGLKAKKPLEEIEEFLYEIRRRSVIIMLAAQKNVKKDKNDDEL